MTCLMAGLALSTVTAQAAETVWLSSLDLSKARQGWEKPQADKSVGGNPMSLKGHKFEHGFGTHSPGMLFIQLNGGATRFLATVGIDDEVKDGKGSAEFQVLGDNHKLLWKSGVLRQGQEPKPVDVDVTGVQQLALRVTTGGDGFEFDHADWADARFEVTGQHPQTVAQSVAVNEPPSVISLASVPANPNIRLPLIAGVRPRTPFLFTVPVTGLRPLQFTARGLPRGLKLDAATGQISGVIEQAGTYSARVRVRNQIGRDQQILKIVAGDNIALTPPLGWNSYDNFGDAVNEAEVLANARYMHEQMQPYGWQYVVIDYRWYDPGATNRDPQFKGAPLTIDKFGRLLPSVNRFPSAADEKGFKALADQVHAMGLRFGIHIMRGIPRAAVKADMPIADSNFKSSEAANTNDTCGWNSDMYGVKGATAAGQAYYDSLFRLYASWGLDFVKVDDMSSPYHKDEIEAVRKAIDKSGRSIVFSLSPGETPIDQGQHVARQANMWRASGDFWDNWNQLNHEFELGAKWHDYVSPGHWPDADMLPVGHIGEFVVGPPRETKFTKAEQLTMLSLWSLLPSPLMVGANLPKDDPWTLALLTNDEVLAVDQDTLGAAARHIAQGDDLEVWVKNLADGSKAVGLFNRGDWSTPVTANWADLQLSGRQTVRDLWQRKDLGVFDGKFEANVPSHGVVLLRLRPVK